MPLLLCSSVVTTVAGVADPGTAVNDRAYKCRHRAYSTAVERLCSKPGEIKFVAAAFL
jgi:hypothetical protein